MRLLNITKIALLILTDWMRPCGRVAGTAIIWRFEIPCGQNISQILLQAPCPDGTKQGRRCSQSTRSWTIFGLLSLECSQRNLPRQSFLEHSGHMVEPTKLGSLDSGKEVVQHTKLYGFLNCTFSRKGLYRELYKAKVPPPPFALGIAFFQSLTKIQANRGGSVERPTEKLTTWQCLKSPVLWPQNNPCINLPTSFIRGYHPKELALFTCYATTSAECTGLVFGKEIIPCSFSRWFSFWVDHTQQKTIECMLVALFRRRQQWQIVLKKHTGDLATPSNDTLVDSAVTVHIYFKWNMNRNGDSPHPCRSPTPTLNSSDITPSTRT